ncbi:MAG: L-serine ammonia-lyase, iron-sulfur-dependent, subunit alpha [Actinobacteria bacterium HGW-Actinobacteria-1]|jgi:L-serine dehydratase|nr:MAG: L-serine ammonia-lyase, iron-sulfur-dependent, subunit alpha [Actinobacteria bacterium HGW-Actinobacteria-1]
MAYGSFRELLAAAAETGSLSSAALAREAEDANETPEQVLARMDDALAVMESAIERGLAGDAHSLSGLVGGDAKLVAENAPRLSGDGLSTAIARALAVGEVNASMGRIVAAPTGGASGVLPAVLTTIAERVGATREATVLALVTAAGIGAVIAARATLSGAAGGCQAEIGSAAAMAAAAATELAGGTPEQCGHAASFALQGLLGLACDPVGGLVEVPCVARNATGTAVALTGIEMALAGATFPIPLDEVIVAMGLVGKSMPPSLRETARGGLARTPTGQAIAAKLP